MKHELEIVVDDKNRTLISECMKVHTNDDEVLFDKEYKFDDGVRLALRICSSQNLYEEESTDNIWTEGILFSPEGAELAVTDVDDNIYGEYLFFVGDDEYHALVK